MKNLLKNVAIIAAILVIIFGTTAKAQIAHLPAAPSVYREKDSQYKLFPTMPAGAIVYSNGDQAISVENGAYYFLTGITGQTEIWYLNSHCIEAKFIHFSKYDVKKTSIKVLLNEGSALKNMIGNMDTYTGALYYKHIDDYLALN